MSKISFAVQPKSLLIPLTCENVTGAVMKFVVEFVCLPRKQAEVKLAEWDRINNTYLNAVGKLEEWELARLDHQTESARKEFLRSLILSFRDVTIQVGDDSFLIKNSMIEGDKEGLWGGSEPCTDFLFNEMWESMPITLALRDAMVAAMQNVKRS